VGYGCSHVAFGVPVYPVDSFFRIVSVVGTNAAVDMRLLGSREAAPRRPQELSRRYLPGIGSDLYSCAWRILTFLGTASTYFANPAFQVKLECSCRPRILAHPSAAEIGTWGQTSDTSAVAKLSGLIELLLWISVVTRASKSQPLILIGANTARSSGGIAHMDETSPHGDLFIGEASQIKYHWTLRVKAGGVALRRKRDVLSCFGGGVFSLQADFAHTACALRHEKTIVLTGTITAFDWGNPIAWST